MISEEERIKIKTTLLRKNKTVTSLAKDLCVPRTRLSQVISGKINNAEIERLLKIFFMDK